MDINYNDLLDLRKITLVEEVLPRPKNCPVRLTMMF